MPREYLPYAIIETAFVFTDHRYLSLPPVGKLVYLTLWCRAFNERRATLQPPTSLPPAIARDTAADRRTVAKMLQKCHKAGLIKKHRNGSITVIGVRGKGNLMWKDHDDTGQDPAPLSGSSCGEPRQEMSSDIDIEGGVGNPPPPWISFLVDHPDRAWATRNVRCVTADGKVTTIGERILEAFAAMGTPVERAIVDFKKRPLSMTKRGDPKFCSDLLTNYADEVSTKAAQYKRDCELLKHKAKETEA